MRKLSVVLLVLLMWGSAQAQKGDTIHLQPSDLDIKGLQMGDWSYIIVHQKPHDSIATAMTLVKMNLSREMYHDKPAIVVRQRWDKDSVIHKAYTVFDATNFATLLHDTYWRALGYALIYDFETRKFSSRHEVTDIPDSIRTGCEQEFDSSFGKFNFNWHDDLVLYSMLPYKENRTFLINFYDPGFGKPQEVPYTVTGSDILTGRGGEKIDCWVLSYSEDGSTQRFWISKKGKEVLKEEDRFSNGGFRFKYKVGISAS